MALTRSAKILRYSVGDTHQDTYQPALANASVYAGSIALTNSAGLAKSSVSPASTDTCWGLYNGIIDTAPALDSPIVVGTTNGANTLGIETGTFYLLPGSNADALVQADVGATVYVIDEVTVGKTDGGLTRPVAGKLVGIGKGQYAAFVAVLLGNNQSTGSP